MHVVIIEPSRVVQAKIAAELEATGAYVDCFGNSDEALDYIQMTETVDVIITSLETEPMGGLEMCWEIRTFATDSNRPIHLIVMSSNNTERAVSEALDSGADDFIVKPVGRTELNARLRAANRIIHLQRQLIEQARTDQLTGLLNKRAFSNDVAARKSELDENEKITVGLCTIDQATELNDRHGADICDLAFQMVGRLTAEEAPIVARLETGEFALAFPILEAHEAAHWCEMIRQAVAAEPLATPSGEIPLTISIGLTEWAEDESLAACLNRSHKAVVEAASNGNKIVTAKSPAAMEPAA